MKKISLLIALVVLLWAPVAQAGISRPPTVRGLVGYWSMEDCKRTTATDSSGSGNTGTLTNFALTGATSNWVTGKIGACALNLDGTDDYVDAGNSASLQITGSMTISAWFKRSQAGVDMFVGKWATAGNKGYYIEIYTDNKIYTGVSGDGSTSVYFASTATYTDSQWHHIVGVYNGSTLRAYLDGALISGSITGAVPGSIYNSAATFKLGRYDSLYSNGSIDDVRVYNRALTGNEISNLYSSGAIRAKPATTRGLVGYWDFEDCKLDKASDNSGRGNTGTLTNFALTGTTSNWVAGKLGACALNFDGNNDYLNAGTSISIGSLTTNLTVSAWINSSSLSGIRRIVGASRPTTSNGFAFGTSGTGLLFTTFSVKDYTSTTITLSLNTWTHVVAVMSGFNVTYYVNGVSAQTITGTANGNANTDDALYIGASTPLGSSTLQELFLGSIDDVRIYNRALSANEITDLYNATNTRYNTSTATLQAGTGLASGLVGHWTFDGGMMTSTKAKDSTTNLNHGTLTGANGLPRPTVGQLGQALKFDGVDDYVAAVGNENSTYSASAWVKTTSSDAAEGIIEYSDSAGNRRGIGLANGAPVVSYGTLKYRVASAAINNGEWRHVAVVYNGATPVLYVDGSPATIGNELANAGVGSASILRIADFTATGSYKLNGSIDDVRVYNRALSATEVLQLYNLGR